MLKQTLFCLLLFLFSCNELENVIIKKIKTKNGELVNSDNNRIILRGISSHGLAWYPSFYHYDSIRTLRDDWKINVFRAAMYTEGWGGYIQNPAIKEKVNEIVKAAIELDIYVIIDWHILSDGNPMTHIEQSKKFFDEMSKKWSNYPNVIYEICNEPNGWANWDNSIKQYAEQVIPIIRKNAPESMIIVGTGTWSQDILAPISSPLKFDNISYALHFYAGTHGEWLRDRIKTAKAKGLNIFVSEWGMSQASGNGGVYRNESKAWLDYLESEYISHVNWSLAPKNESSAALRENASPSGFWDENALSESGKWVRSYLRSKGND